MTGSISSMGVRRVSKTTQPTLPPINNGKRNTDASKASHAICEPNTDHQPNGGSVSQLSSVLTQARKEPLPPKTPVKPSSVQPLSESVVAPMIMEFGLKTLPSNLTKVQAQKKNMSPFDADMFLPMLRPVPKMKEGKMTLLLDIDETLVHASVKPRPDLRYDTVVSIKDGASSGDIYVAFRPHLHTFLKAVAPHFEIAVFTASQSCYADPLMNTIDPSRSLVSDRLYREHCVEVQGGRIKDLNLVGRPLDRTIIIDNSPIAYCFQPRNAIPIKSWFEDPDDDELLRLIPFLVELSAQQTVFPMLDMLNAHLLSGFSIQAA